MNGILELVNKFIDDNVNDKMICCDMTCGNGNDTLHLCKLSSFVYGFDIQQIAIDNTKDKLIKESVTNYKLILDSHENIDKYIDNKIDLFIYNLGYLPRGDKSITTIPSSTISSLKKALDMLNEQGKIVMVIYTGHEMGKKEEKELIPFVNDLPQDIYSVLKLQYINQINNPPYALIITKR